MEIGVWLALVFLFLLAVSLLYIIGQEIIIRALERWSGIPRNREK